MHLIQIGDKEYPDFIPSIGRVSNVTESLRGENDIYRSRPADVSARTKEESSMQPDAMATTLKRTLDIAVGLAGSAVFVLAYPIIALLIRLESPGPALYTQTRVGMDKRSRRDDPAHASQRKQDVGGALFTICKFRTMRLDAESNGPQLCGKGGDPRVTRLGRLLRSSHLDELPQFWNVLKGEMSFIGPRPERPHFTVKYFEQIPAYRERTRLLKPGITGLAQIALGYDDSLDSVIRKTSHDLAYRASLSGLRSWLRLEGWIILNTFRYLWNRAPLGEVALPSPHLALALIRNRGVVTPTVVVTQSHAQPQPSKPLQQMDARVANFMTIDVECWFHAHNLAVPRSDWEASPTRVVANVRRILDLLEFRKAKATFFVLGWVADRHPDMVRMIAAAGHEIGTHGYFHEKVTDLTPYQFEKDLEMSLNSLASLTSQKIVGHRASNFSIVESTLWALEILARNGIEYDSSIFPVARKRYGIGGYPNLLPHNIVLDNGATIREIPMSTLNLAGKALPISGGGYLRLYPYTVTDRFIRGRNLQGLPAMVYFHPWELDAGQERRKVGMLKSFQHYVNLDTTEWKIDRLLEGFRFTSMRENLETDRIQAMLARNPVEARMAIASNRRPAAHPAEASMMETLAA